MTSEGKAVIDIFECQLCGNCCNGFGGTYVTSQDIINISTYLCCDPEKFIEIYCDPSGSRHVLTQGKDGACIFFDNIHQCTIHPVKPYMCKAWPFIQAVIKHPENWNAMAGACPGMEKNIPYKDLQKIVAEEKEKLDKSLQDFI
ncbi:MAG: YkgJ family cysteine cluster protein [Proteobacteria bacterium]|nr:YkgJ family cysteine cluster protein [Pseudomonadota bacterium]MBU1695543.1 YkgJ family cysteine cluster protein [Pseudomonadota bacterium]